MSEEQRSTSPASCQVIQFYTDADNEDYHALQRPLKNKISPPSMMSIILSVIKSLKPGTDMMSYLTPSFVYNGRSLLENVADYARPNKSLLTASSATTADIRLVHVLQWVLEPLGSVHKNSLVGIKPFTPVPGETFDCQWDHKTTMPGSPEDAESVDSGDANVTRLIAEQVTNDPPTCVCYLSNKKAGFSFRSKTTPAGGFSGNRVDIVFQGDGILTLSTPQHGNEEYIIRKPSFTVKGIIIGTTSFELADKLVITCAKTGLEAEIKFNGQTVSGIITAKTSAPLYKISGSLKSSITIEPQGQSDTFKRSITSKQVLVNYLTTSFEIKQTKSLDEQGEMESRKLWHKASMALRRGDFEEATKQIAKVEEVRKRQLELIQQNKFQLSYFAKSSECITGYEFLSKNL